MNGFITICKLCNEEIIVGDNVKESVEKHKLQCKFIICICGDKLDKEFISEHIKDCTCHYLCICCRNHILITFKDEHETKCEYMYCPAKCGEIIAKSTMQQHLPELCKMFYKCKCCDMYFNTNGSEEHILKCDKKLAMCNLCKKEFKDISEHKCNFVICPNGCEMIIKTNKLEEHFNGICQQMSCCGNCMKCFATRDIENHKINCNMQEECKSDFVKNIICESCTMKIEDDYETHMINCISIPCPMKCGEIIRADYAFNHFEYCKFASHCKYCEHYFKSCNIDKHRVNCENKCKCCDNRLSGCVTLKVECIHCKELFFMDSDKYNSINDHKSKCDKISMKIVL